MPGSDYRAEKNQRIQQRIQELQRELPSFVVAFIRSLITSTGILTRLAYCYDCRLFLRFLSAEVPLFGGIEPQLMTAEMIDRLTLQDLEMYVEFLTMYVRQVTAEEALEQGPVFVTNVNVSISRKLSSLRSLFKYMEAHGLIQKNIALKLPMPKIKQKEIIYLDIDEIARLFDVVNTGSGLTKRQQVYNQRFRSRDIAILSLLLGTGIRESEMIALDIDDMDLDSLSFLVYRKGGKEQIIYFNQAVKDALLDYLIDREKIEPSEGHEKALFLSSQRKRLSARALQDLVKKYANVAAPLKKKLSPHKLRASFATGLYRESGDVYMVGEALGHERIETTTHYAKRGEEEGMRAARIVSWIPDDGSDPG